MIMKQIPTLSADLIRQLAKDEPELSIKPDLTKAVIMFMAGRRAVIEELLVRQEYYDKQKSNEIQISSPPLRG